MPNRLSKLWARVTGIAESDTEVAALRNTVADDTPAPGDLPGRPTPRDHNDQVPLDDAEREQRYERWEGEDPGH